MRAGSQPGDLDGHLEHPSSSALGLPVKCPETAWADSAIAFTFVCPSRAPPPFHEWARLPRRPCMRLFLEDGECTRELALAGVRVPAARASLITLDYVWLEASPTCLTIRHAYIAHIRRVQVFSAHTSPVSVNLGSISLISIYSLLLLHQHAGPFCWGRQRGGVGFSCPSLYHCLRSPI